MLALAERLFDGSQQVVNALAALCGNLHALIRPDERDNIRIALIRLVVHHHARNILCAELCHNLIHSLCMNLPIFVRNVHDMQQQIGIRQLLERCLERRYEMMRQLADEAYGIGQKDFLRIRNAFFTRGRVERIEQTVIRLDARTGQGVQQRGLARIRVADNGNQRQLGLFALAALHGAHLTHLLQITAQLVDAAADVTAVALQLALTGSARADAAAESAHRLAHTRQTRQNVLVLRQLDLQLALAGARTLRENIEDERRAVEYRAAGQLLQIAHLRRRQLVVEQDQTCVVHLGKLLNLFRLALTDKRAGIRRRTALQRHRNGLRTGSLRQRAQLVHRALVRILIGVEARTRQTDQNRPFDLLFFCLIGKRHGKFLLAVKLSSIFITPKRKTVQDLIFRPICGNIKVDKVNIFPSRQTVADFLLYRKCPIVVSQRTLR